MNSGTIPYIVQNKLEQIGQELERLGGPNIFRDIKPAKNGRVVKYFDSEKNGLSLKVKFSPPTIKILSIHGKWKSMQDSLERVTRSNGRM